MRYPHLYELVHFRPWIILPSYHAAIADVLDRRLQGFPAEDSVSHQRPKLAADTLAGASEFAPATVDADGIATIQVNGIIAKGASAFEKSCYGGVSPEDISRSLAAAVGGTRWRSRPTQSCKPPSSTG